MKPIHDAWLIQIEVTNACPKRCAHCTRACGHFSKPYFASLEFVERALQSMKGWNNGIGCMGGEPTIHPRFAEICRLYQEYVPRERAGLWTSGGPGYEMHKELIEETFGIQLYNDHSEVGRHQPLFVASEEIVPDEKLRNELIDHCWIQETWSPSINQKGGFFCEVAATMSLLFDGPEGFPLEPQWWQKSVEDFRPQRDYYCRWCSIAIPLRSLPNNLPFDFVSKGNAERLRKARSPKALKGELKIFNKPYTREIVDKIAALCHPSPGEYLGPRGIRDSRSMKLCNNKEVQNCD